jgi:hybrid cluster-associated redox disulfide protein
MKITKDTPLAEVLKKKGAEEILAKHNVPCVTCPMAQFEIQKLTLGQICEMYGIKLEKLLKELNKNEK